VKAYSRKARKTRVYTSQYANKLKGVKTAPKIRNRSKPKRKVTILGNGFTLSLLGGIGTANVTIQIMKKTNKFIVCPKINDLSALFKTSTRLLAGEQLVQE